MKYPEIAKRFHYILSLRNLKQTELAEKANINKSFISHYMNGTHCPSNDKAQVLADILGVNPLWLMGLDDNMFKNVQGDLTEAELKMLTLFNSLNDSRQQTALEHLMFLNSQEKHSADPQKDS